MAKKVKEQDEKSKQLVSIVQTKYNVAYNAKAELHKEWKDCWAAYDGSYFKVDAPSYKAQEQSNYVFSTIETVIPVMMSGNPKFIALPNREQDYPKSEVIQKALDYEWQRTRMFTECVKGIRDLLVTGNIALGLFWNGKKDGIGQIEPMLLSPFNVFVDPKATCVDDAEYMGYACYKNVGEVVSQYPDFKELLEASTSVPQYEDLNFGKDASQYRSDSTILFVEMYMRDYSTEITYEEEQDESGKTQKYEVRKMKYPEGRRIIIAGDVLLYDGENPYIGGKFPFRICKCYEVPGQFWGRGEAYNIISPQKYRNTIINSIIESAELMSNPIWILDKNSGVEKNSLTNRKGLVVRKNPGTEVRREQPPAMPAYLQDIIQLLSQDIEHISGVYDVTRGERPTGITAAAAIQALNEQAQGRIKLKVQILEQFLGELAAMWLERIQQFWETKRDVRILGADYKVSFAKIDRDDVDGDFDVIVAAGSTMPINKAARIQQFVQLAQTQAEDGLPMIDRQTVLENADLQNLQEVLQRFAQIKQQQQQAQQMQQQAQLEAQQQQMMMQQQAEQQKMQMQSQMQEQQAQADHGRQMEQQVNQSALQTAQGQIQSEIEGQAQSEQQAFMQVVQMIAQMSPEEIAAAAKKDPRILQVIEMLSQQPNTRR